MKIYITYDWRDGSIEFSEVADSENGTPMWLYHGLGVRFCLPERQYDAEEIVEEFREKFGEQLDALREGFAEVWDGHNHVGRWAGNAEKRYEALYGIIHLVEEWDPQNGLEIWDASDYYHGGLTTEQIIRELKITATTTDEQLVEITKDAQDAALVEGRKLSRLSEFVEHMRTVAIEMRDDEEGHVDNSNPSMCGPPLGDVSGHRDDVEDAEPQSVVMVACAGCGWCTDLEPSSPTNPRHCPKCGGEIARVA